MLLSNGLSGKNMSEYVQLIQKNNTSMQNNGTNNISRLDFACC